MYKHVALATMVYSILLAACSQVTNRESIVGVYEMKGDGRKIELELADDGTFTERIINPSEKIVHHAGRWNWADGRISFDVLWIPTAFAPSYIVDADSIPGSVQPKYTERGHWLVSPVTSFGHVHLPIFPDADIGFVKIQE